MPATTNEIIAEINAVKSGLIELMQSLDEGKVNTVPYTGSWTAGQLLRHVSKSTNGIAQAMGIAGKPANRDAGERIPELKVTFLDFASKMQSPETIVPEERTYEKQESMEELNSSFKTLKQAADKANVTDLVDGLPLGPITKLELLHFVLYHTQRHLHQMKKICAALEA